MNGTHRLEQVDTAHLRIIQDPAQQITRKPKSTTATMSDVRRIGFTELSGSKDVTRGPYRVKYGMPMDIMPMRLGFYTGRRTRILYRSMAKTLPIKSSGSSGTK